MSTKPVTLGPPATLAEVLDRVATLDQLPRQRRHDLMSAVRQVARLLGGLPADVPANPEALKRGLKLLSPAAADMTKSRWRNVRALLIAALELTGAKIFRRGCRTELAPSWLALTKCVDDRYERFRLSRFFSYASANGIEPDQVDDQTVANFDESLSRNSLLERQTQVVRDLCLAWNRCSGSIEGWPAARLTVPNRRRDYALPPSTYPASFGADVDAYLAHLAGGDLFDATGRGPASPATLRDVRLRLFQLAAALVHSGRAPETIQSLADLVAPDALKAALNFFWHRNGKRKTGQIHNFALTATKIAKHHVKAPPEQVAALQAIRRQVDPKNSGMTARNRARLRQFDDHENRKRLINLPQAILRALPRSGAPSYDQAIRLQSAVAIEILLTAPIRSRNLAALRFGQHVVQTRAGGARHIVIPAEEVKNRIALAFEVSDMLQELMDVYLARCRPLLADHPDGFLFPARKGGAKTPAHLAAQIKRTIKQETGIDLNAHAFRHLAALLFLREHPGEYETTRTHSRPQEHRDDGQGLLRPRAGRRAASLRRPHRPSAQAAGDCLVTRRPPIAGWPARDRALWEEGVEAKGLFESYGAGAGWSEGSRYKTAVGYNAWLSWLAAKNLLDPDLSPVDRVTPERAVAYIAELQAERAPYTVLCRVQELYDALRVVSPETNSDWLAQLYRTLRPQVRPARQGLAFEADRRARRAWRAPHGRSRNSSRLVGAATGRSFSRWPHNLSARPPAAAAEESGNDAPWPAFDEGEWLLADPLRRRRDQIPCPLRGDGSVGA